MEGMNARPPAVLLGGQASTLSVARSLGKAGVEVIAVGDAQSSPARFSRFCSRFVDVGAGPDVQDRWLEWLEQGPAGAVLLPCTDAAMELIARRRGTLEAHPYLVYEASDELALAMLDKEKTYGLSRAAGVRTPATMPIESAADMDAVETRIGFPCGFKPLHPVAFRQRYGFARKLFVVRNEAELRSRFAETDAYGLSMLATELIPGGDDRVWGWIGFIDESGDVLLDFTKHKLRQFPPNFGIGTYHISARNPEVSAAAIAFCRSAGLRGLVAVELKQHEHDGEYVLMECNHRFSNATEILPAAGIDAALLVYNRLAGLPRGESNPFREGVRLLHVAEDVRAFRQLRREGKLTFPAYLRSLAHRQHFAFFRLDDPLPSVGYAAAAVQRRLATRAA